MRWCCAAARNLRATRVPGRDLAGIHFAVDYLTQQNRRCEGDVVPDDQFITAAGKRVVIIGGGDTGADCLGTVHRQGAIACHQFELLPRPPASRPATTRGRNGRECSGRRPRTKKAANACTRCRPNASSATGKGASARCTRSKWRWFATGGMRFQPVADTQFELPVDLVLLAMGFVGPRRGGLLAELGVRMTERGNVWRDENWMTSQPGVFTAGDMQRGQSLIVWAIADGRSVARSVDVFLMGESSLPAPVQ